MFLKLTSLVVLIFALGTTCLVHSQTTYTKWNNGIDKGTWDIGLEIQDAKKMLALWDSIGEDLQTERNSLAGTYFKGGYDAGYFLRWSINKGFVLIPYFDENLITDYSYGNVTFVDSSKIIFNPEKDLKGGRSVAKTPREWTALGRSWPSATRRTPAHIGRRRPGSARSAGAAISPAQSSSSPR